MTGYLLSADLAFPSQVLASTPHVRWQQVLSAGALLERVHGQPPQVVLVDLELRGVDWPTWLGELRAALPGGTPIVAYGPHVRADLLDAARRAECDAVVTRGQLHAQTRAVLDAVLRDAGASGD